MGLVGVVGAAAPVSVDVGAARRAGQANAKSVGLLGKSGWRGVGAVVVVPAVAGGGAVARCDAAVAGDRVGSVAVAGVVPS